MHLKELRKYNNVSIRIKIPQLSYIIKKEWMMSCIIVFGGICEKIYELLYQLIY